jgi:hypothetical protein
MRYTRPVVRTEYQGIRYRSRLEARWAVFFDALAIKFQYEPRVPRIAYLPDFFVAHQPRFPRSMYFEVKPAEYEPSDTIKPDSLAALHFPVGFLHALRVPRAMHDGCEHEVFFGGSWDESHGFCKCSSCGAIGFEFEGRSERIACPCQIHEEHTDTADELVAAYRTAISYRFSSTTATPNQSLQPTAGRSDD